MIGTSNLGSWRSPIDFGFTLFDMVKTRHFWWKKKRDFPHWPWEEVHQGEPPPPENDTDLPEKLPGIEATDGHGLVENNKDLASWIWLMDG